MKSDIRKLQERALSNPMAAPADVGRQILPLPGGWAVALSVNR